MKQTRVLDHQSGFYGVGHSERHHGVYLIRVVLLFTHRQDGQKTRNGIGFEYGQTLGPHVRPRNLSATWALVSRHCCEALGCFASTQPVTLFIGHTGPPPPLRVHFFTARHPCGSKPRTILCRGRRDGSSCAGSECTRRWCANRCCRRSRPTVRTIASPPIPRNHIPPNSKKNH